MRILQILRSERGVTTILIVGVYLILLGFVGMATDFGIILRYRRAMQNACDSGALAGALDLRNNPAGAIPTAERYASTDMVPNRISWTGLEATTYDKDWQPTLIDPRILRVVIQATVPTFFLRLVADSVPVAVDCAAKLTPIILTKGLVPLGLDYTQWAPLYDPITGAPCADDVAAGVPLAERSEPCRSFEIKMENTAEDNPWGNGNTGMLSMSDCYDCPSGASQWMDTFINGSNQSYCYDTAHSTDVTDYSMNGQPCANVMTKPGTVTGPVRTAVDARCDSEDPMDRIIMMPLLNPQYSVEGQGRYTTEIWGFTAFELDCVLRTDSGGGKVTIHGGFISIVSMQAVGTTTDFDTGVYTVKLIK